MGTIFGREEPCGSEFLQREKKKKEKEEVRERQPMFEFIHYPKFGEAERACPAVKIVYTLYSDEQTLHDMREQFDYFLKACSYHIPLEEEE